MSEKHPGPWTWGPDWARVDRVGLPDENEYHDKYLDLGLYDADGEGLIGIRVDHYEPIWNTHKGVGEVDLPKPVRDLIVVAPDLLAALEAVRDFEDGSVGQKMIARAAIAKATDGGAS